MKTFTSIIILLLLSLDSHAKNIDSQTIINNMKTKYSGMKDYQCRLDEWCAKGKKEEKRILNYYFKKPELIRIDILEGNRPFDKGSVGVYKGDNRVSGHRGGILSSVNLSLSKYNPLATSIRGVTFDESGIRVILESAEFYLEKGTVTYTVSGNTYILTCLTDYKSENQGITKDIIVVDSKEWLPVLSERYEGNNVVQKAVWKDYIINAGLPDEFFDTRYDPERLIKQGIKLLSQK